MLKQNCKTRAFTLTEMVVAISVVAIATAITIPAIYAVREGFSSSGADTLISAALSSAKAIAAKEQKYAGVRFQCVPDPERPGEPGDQYIILIIHDPNAFASGFRAARGVAPMKLPTNEGVMDLIVKDKPIAIDTDIDDMDKLRDTTSFSMIFSPSGRLVTHEVRVWNKDGKAVGDDTSEDMVFNTRANVDGAIAGTTPTAANTYKGMFYQDECPLMGICPESSRLSFVIYDKRELRKVPVTARWSGFLQKLAAREQLYINPYTGTIIENDNRRNSMR